MAFESEVRRLNMQDKVLLRKLITRWETKNTNAVKALYDDRFLPQPQMQNLTRRLVQFGSNKRPIGSLEPELKHHCKSFLELKGGAVNQKLIPRYVGTFVSEGQLQDHLLINYGFLFPHEASFQRFLRNAEKPGPAAWIHKNGLGGIHFRADGELLWFYWDAEGDFGDMLGLLKFIARKEAKIAGLSRQPFVFLIFGHPGQLKGKNLCRPTWGDYGLSESHPIRPCPNGRFGLTGNIPTTVSHCTYLPLAYLQSLKIEYL